MPLQPEVYHPITGGKVPAGMPLGLETYTALQQIANEVSGEALVARRLLDVDYVEQMVPVGLPGFGEPATVDGVSVYAPSPPPVGTLLRVGIELDALELQSVAECPRLAALPGLVLGARKAALAESRCVFNAIADLGTPVEVPKGSLGDLLLAAIDALRLGGFSGELSLVIGSATWAEVNRLGDDGGARLTRRLEQETGGRIVVLADSPSYKAIVLAPGRENVRLVVGDNYALQWLSTDGVRHSFAMTVGFRVVVTDRAAVQVVGRPKRQGDMAT
jgi:uncharacterized linocin/CFP29 family protein